MSNRTGSLQRELVLVLLVSFYITNGFSTTSYRSRVTAAHRRRRRSSSLACKCETESSAQVWGLTPAGSSFSYNGGLECSRRRRVGALARLVDPDVPLSFLSSQVRYRTSSRRDRELVLLFFSSFSLLTNYLLPPVDLSRPTPAAATPFLTCRPRLFPLPRLQARDGGFTPQQESNSCWARFSLNGGLERAAAAVRLRLNTSAQPDVLISSVLPLPRLQVRAGGFSPK